MAKQNEIFSSSLYLSWRAELAAWRLSYPNPPESLSLSIISHSDIETSSTRFSLLTFSSFSEDDTLVDQQRFLPHASTT
ncbi:hypothetical protein JTE90_000727 [Oedothorax gibbosus]|uniref:Uncharacterized protein n=1 Tax=Oedothorax gibbosus TaxID=931172 RepID=A0AAV6UQ34_9ARAC|nr:hypothetical protein JTE90_000727 [Oedothorax gibbosus]